MEKRSRILITDDDVHLRAGIIKSLKDFDYEIEEAGTLAECREKMAERMPDLILLDLVLPDGDGLEFAGQIANDPSFHNPGILLMSGLKADKRTVSRGLGSGALYFSSKPLDMKDLVQRIQLIFRVKELERNRLRMEVRFEHLLSNTSDLLFLLSENGVILNLSKSYEDICGIPPAGKINRNFIDIVAPVSKAQWTRNLARVVDNIVIPSFEIFLLNDSGNHIPFDLQITKSQDEDSTLTVVIGIGKDLRNNKLLEAETEGERNKSNDNRREASVWEKMSVSQTNETRRTYEVSALEDEDSDTFKHLLQVYRELVDSAMEQRIYRIEKDQKQSIMVLANELGFLKAGPQDLVRLHSSYYRGISESYNVKKLAAYHEEARIILLSVMGYLVTYYRNRKTV